MPADPEPAENTRAGAGVFATTHWTVVLTAADHSNPDAQRALEISEGALKLTA
jgi:hypothetical protein